MTPLAAVLAVLATVRLTLLVTRDVIPFEYVRAWLTGRSDADPGSSFKAWPADLVTCSWCLSAYVGASVAVWAWHGSGEWWFTIPAVALGGSLLAGIVGELLDS